MLPEELKGQRITYRDEAERVCTGKFFGCFPFHKEKVTAGRLLVVTRETVGGEKVETGMYAMEWPDDVDLPDRVISLERYVGE